MGDRPSYRWFLIALLFTTVVGCRPSRAVGCDDSCVYARDGECDDGRPAAVTSLCDPGTDCTDCGGAPEPQDGWCGGEAVDPGGYMDSASCHRQGGEWWYSSRDCWGTTDDDCDDATAEWECVQRIGCTWHRSDGTEATNRYTGGACIGVTPDCDVFVTLEQCYEQGALCQWSSYGSCVRTHGFDALYNIADCSGISGFAAAASAHWEIAYDACLDLFGCSWRYADGSIEEGPKTAWELIQPPDSSFRL